MRNSGSYIRAISAGRTRRDSHGTDLVETDTFRNSDVRSRKHPESEIVFFDRERGDKSTAGVIVEQLSDYTGQLDFVLEKGPAGSISVNEE